MNKLNEKQLEVENFFIDNNKKFPDTWTWNENKNGLFCLESTTNKKRYGIIRKCLHCSRDFIARHSWLKKASTCSVFCRGSIQQAEKHILTCGWCKKTIFKKESEKIKDF